MTRDFSLGNVTYSISLSSLVSTIWDILKDTLSCIEFFHKSGIFIFVALLIACIKIVMK